MKGKKKILLAVVLVLVMAVGITSIVVIRNRNKTVVKVFPVSSLNSSDWFDTDTSLTGTLTSDYIQEVHIDGGQKVKKVYVKKGDKREVFYVEIQIDYRVLLQRQQPHADRYALRLFPYDGLARSATGKCYRYRNRRAERNERKRTCLFAFSGKGETGRRVSDSRF